MTLTRTRPIDKADVLRPPRLIGLDGAGKFKPCRYDGHGEAWPTGAKGPHAGGWRCAHCGAHLGWLTVDEAKRLGVPREAAMTATAERSAEPAINDAPEPPW